MWGQLDFWWLQFHHLIIHTCRTATVEAWTIGQINGVNYKTIDAGWGSQVRCIEK